MMKIFAVSTAACAVGVFAAGEQADYDFPAAEHVMEDHPGVFTVRHHTDFQQHSKVNDTTENATPIEQKWVLLKDAQKEFVHIVTQEQKHKVQAPEEEDPDLQVSFHFQKQTMAMYFALTVFRMWFPLVHKIGVVAAFYVVLKNWFNFHHRHHEHFKTVARHIRRAIPGAVSDPCAKAVNTLGETGRNICKKTKTEGALDATQNLYNNTLELLSDAAKENSQPRREAYQTVIQRKIADVENAKAKSPGQSGDDTEQLLEDSEKPELRKGELEYIFDGQN